MHLEAFLGSRSRADKVAILNVWQTVRFLGCPNLSPEKVTFSRVEVIFRNAEVTFSNAEVTFRNLKGHSSRIIM